MFDMFLGRKNHSTTDSPSQDSTSVSIWDNNRQRTNDQKKRMQMSGQINSAVNAQRGKLLEKILHYDKRFV